MGEMVNALASSRELNPFLSLRLHFSVGFLGDLNCAPWFDLKSPSGSLRVEIPSLAYAPSLCTLDFSLANTLAGDSDRGFEYCIKC